MSTDRASGHFSVLPASFPATSAAQTASRHPAHLSMSALARRSRRRSRLRPFLLRQSTRRETSQENQTARQDRAPTHQSEQVAHRFKPNDASKPGPEPATCRSFDCLWRSLHYAAVHAAIRHSPSRSSEPVASLLKNGPLDSSNVVPHSNVR